MTTRFLLQVLVKESASGGVEDEERTTNSSFARLGMLSRQGWLVQGSAARKVSQCKGLIELIKAKEIILLSTYPRCGLRRGLRGGLGNILAKPRYERIQCCK